jgi:glyoxylase-like metal-dependent hydrolase (beta-lactamase superfamily II)
VRKPTRRREVGRGERVVRGAWRLRLPLPFPGVPHCNAWALDAGDGIVLVDTGAHEPGSMGDLERALWQAGRRVEDVRLVVITHAHADHSGQAPVIAERAGCEVWIHPAYRLHVERARDPEEALRRRVEVARASGVPEAPLARWEERQRGSRSGQARPLRSDRDLVPGVTVETDLGAWDVYETPGHAPSHVCLHLPAQRMLISGDHLLGRISLYFDIGYTPDPVGEFLHSLDVIEPLDARLALSGHGRPFTEIAAHIRGNRELVAARLEAAAGALAGDPRTAYEVAREVYGERFSDEMASWLMTKTLAYLTHLAARGDVRREPGSPERWSGST